MISVVTTTYNTPPHILARTWASLKAQTYTDWEWVVYDDSTTDKVWNQVYGFCSDERYNVRLFKPHVPSNGNIGLVKHNAFMLGHGHVLVELDHDDELTPDCLQKINDAFDNNPDVGFVYSDWCEIFPDGTSGRYPEGWAFGYGSDYWSEQYGVWVMSAPEINRTTLSHIVSAPNHVRAWKALTYREINGHDVSLVIADDYDLVVRTALNTKMFHIPEMLYKQHIGHMTAQRQRNGLIQELVPQIHDRHSGHLDRLYGK
jgi:glycosyltransferase involved in cell wall biosynthesis